MLSHKEPLVYPQIAVIFSVGDLFPERTDGPGPIFSKPR